MWRKRFERLNLFHMPHNPRIPPNPDQLKSLLRKHLSFEIGRFRKSASLWDKAKYGGVEDAMIRESCLIHMRLLLDFFYPRINPKKSKHEDVFASDYLPERGRLPQELANNPPWLQEYRDQLDWRLAHLTMKRFEFDERPVWQPQEQFGHLERLIAAFLVALPADVRAEFDPDKGWAS